MRGTIILFIALAPARFLSGGGQPRMVILSFGIGLRERIFFYVSGSDYPRPGEDYGPTLSYVFLHDALDARMHGLYYLVRQ